MKPSTAATGLFAPKDKHAAAERWKGYVAARFVPEVIGDLTPAEK